MRQDAPYLLCQDTPCFRNYSDFRRVLFTAPKNVWQRRNWEHTIKDERDLKHHFDTIHFNPVKHEYVKMSSEWQWSSFHRYARKGVYLKDWGKRIEEKKFVSEFGE